LIQGLETHLGVGVNQTTADGEFSLEAVRCVGCCGLAPVMVSSGEVFGKLTPKELPGVLEKIQG
jgi:NADH-quinone oxidoreductase subunit E